MNTPLVLCLSIVMLGDRPATAQGGAYTYLQPSAAPRIVAHAEAYPGRSFLARHFTDDSETTEYASHGQGTETYLVFDFGQPTALAGYRHKDRTDPATIAEAKLEFSNDPQFQRVVETERIQHADRPGAVTRAVFGAPIRARYVRWQVTQLNAAGHRCAGGADIGFFVAAGQHATPVKQRLAIRGQPALERSPEGPRQPVTLTVEHPYAESIETVLRMEGAPPVPWTLRFGRQERTVMVPAARTARPLTVSLESHGQMLLTRRLPLQPVRHWELWILPHSHVDIGYTHVQTEVEQRQWDHLRQAIEIARATADYPPGARFRWNSEVMWAVDSFLQRAPADDRQALLDAVRRGWIHLDGLYGNELTGLCRPEELFQLTACARRVARQHDLVIDSAMISDVPGYTWGLVPALTRGGIKYLSVGPNHIHRIGFTLDQWGDRPFWWVSPSGQERLLFWMAGKAYSWFHGSRVGQLRRDSAAEPFLQYLQELIDKDYPYDMVQIRYSVGGDNGPPDPELPEFVRRWNERYVWPRMRIATTREMMQRFAQRYGDELPEHRGDFTPYWEDGAASTARETALTRLASERLVQAETLWALLEPAHYPRQAFQQAWRDTLLYNEHTWGAHCSITQPDSEFTRSQWKIKRQFARDADRQSRTLLEQALAVRPPAGETVTAIDVWNTTSWPRTDLVTLPAGSSLAGQVVKDAQGRVVPCEPAPGGGLRFVARDVPPFGAQRYRLEAGPAPRSGRVRAADNVLENESLRVEVDPETGAICSLQWNGAAGELVEQGEDCSGLNEFCYVAGRDPAEPVTARVEKIEAVSGNLTGTLHVHGRLPGCRSVVSVVRLVDGIDRVDITDVVDRERVLSPDALHVAFPFRVPGGVMRLDIPWAVIRPEADQLPGACKNYVTVGRWVDVSNAERGVTWATPTAPLVEIGAIRMDVDSPLGRDGWVRRLEPTQHLFSYVMNNYWETNYKAAQEGKTVFRYALKPHGPYDQVASTRFGIECSQPLLVRPVAARQPPAGSRLHIQPDSVLATSLRPSADGQALMLRLWNAGQQAAEATVTWSDPQPARVLVSSPGQHAGAPVDGPISIPPLGIVSLRAEMAAK